VPERLAERHHDRQHAEHAAALTAGDVDADLDAATVPASPPPADTDPSLDPQTAESLRILRATQVASITEALRSPPAPAHPRAPRPAPRRGPPGPADRPSRQPRRRQARCVLSGLAGAPDAFGAGERLLAELDVQRLIAVGVNERLQFGGVLEQARARQRRTRHPAQHAL